MISNWPENRIFYQDCVNRVCSTDLQFLETRRDMSVTVWLALQANLQYTEPKLSGNMMQVQP